MTILISIRFPRIKGMSEFNSNQKTDIKNLEEVIHKAIRLKDNKTDNNLDIKLETKELIINKIKIEILTLANDVVTMEFMKKLFPHLNMNIGKITIMIISKYR